MNDTGWLQRLYSEEARNQREALRERVLLWLGIVCAVILVVKATNAHAAPMFQAQAEGVKIVIYDEPCKLEQVVNLKHRATWHEKGKVYEGCAGPHPAFPIIMGYFADKTVVALPVEMFTRVSGA